MIDPELQRLADAPLADPLFINLPKGRRSAPRRAIPAYEGEFSPERLTSEQVAERKTKAALGRLGEVLTYYAKTTIPFARIAVHTGLSVERVEQEMRNRGRAA